MSSFNKNENPLTSDSAVNAQKREQKPEAVKLGSDVHLYVENAENSHQKSSISNASSHSEQSEKK